MLTKKTLASQMLQEEQDLIFFTGSCSCNWLIVCTFLNRDMQNKESLMKYHFLLAQIRLFSSDHLSLFLRFLVILNGVVFGFGVQID